MVTAVVALSGGELRASNMLSRQGAALFKRAGVRAFAAPGKGKGGGGAAIVEEAVDLTRFVPTNIFKEGAHPELKEKDEYPAWLFTLLDTKPTVGELERQGFDNLSLEEQRRYLTLTNRKIVKTNNAAKSKK